MKIQRLLARFLLLNYGFKSSRYWSLPKNLCNAFWMTILAIVLLPLTWCGMILDMFVFNRSEHRDKMEELKNVGRVWVRENSVTGIFINSVIGIFFLMIGAILLNEPSGFLGSISQFIESYIPAFVEFFILQLVGIILIFLILAIGSICVVLCLGIEEYINNFKRKRQRNLIPSTKGKTRQAIKDLWGALMNKYCMKINWNLKEEENANV